MQQQMQTGSRSTVLCVEADQERRELLEAALHNAGFDTMRTTNQEAVIQGLRHILPDLVIVDLDHCGGNGIELCRWIRSERITSRLPVILLSSQWDEPDRIAALECGADEILAVPFNDRELIARIKSLLRWSGMTPSAFLKTGAILVDAGRRQVQFLSQTVSLTPTEFQLLQFIAGEGAGAGGGTVSDEQHTDEWTAVTDSQQMRISRFLESKSILPASEASRSVG